jgi:hypothetical protein
VGKENSFAPPGQTFAVKFVERHVFGLSRLKARGLDKRASNPGPTNDLFCLHSNSLNLLGQARC